MDKVLSIFKLLSSDTKPSITLLTLWVMSLVACICLGLASVVYQWSGMSVNFGGVEVYITVYPPLVISMFWVIWAGFWWGFVPAYIATLVLALYSGVPIMWSMIFAFADPLGLAVFAMVYRAIPINTDLHDINSILFFILISFVSSIMGSSGAFIWVHSNNLDINNLYEIWQGWWLGAFLQNLMFVAPALFFFNTKITSINKTLSTKKEQSAYQSILFITGLILAMVLIYLYLAIGMSSQKMTMMLPESLHEIAVFMSDSLGSILWVVCTLISFIAFFSYQLFVHGTKALDTAATELETINSQLQRQVIERQLLNNQLEQKVDQRTEQLLLVNKKLTKSIDAVEKSNRAKSEFLANMSHEIRTPMNGMLGMSQILGQSNLTTKQQGYLRSIQRSGDTLMVVINDILDYSKIEANKLALQPAPFNLLQLIEDIMAPYFISPHPQIKFNIFISDDVPAEIESDSVRLHQILNNLINNAFKFTQQGQIDLRIQLSDSPDDKAHIHFSVADTGKGIQRELLDVLFDPFTQEDQSSSRQYGGTGLGLSICKRLVTLMGGDISVQSEVGIGSRFQFSIECKTTSVMDADMTTPVNTGDFSKLRVLVAEDNTLNQVVTRALMRELGVEIQLASDGKEAVDLACNSTYPFDLILMDCEMPRMDGYEATQEIRQWEQNKKIPSATISALTAHVLPEHIERCRKVGMNKHLPKPSSLADFKKILEHVNNKVTCPPVKPSASHGEFRL